MIAAGTIDQPAAMSSARAFLHATDTILCHIVNLVNAINRENFAIAWLLACELGRGIVRAESLALRMTPDGARRCGAIERVDSLRLVASHALTCAPRPSPLAIAQAWSPEPGLDRNAWAAEEQQWLTARRAAGPLCLVICGDNLILRNLSI